MFDDSVTEKKDKKVIMEWYKERINEISEKSPIYSCCGDDCAVCPRYNAKTEDELKQTAQFWYEIGWRDHIVSNDKICCKGCKTSKNCTFMILPCMNEHAVSKCRECIEYPCEKIEDMLRCSKITEKECRKHCTGEDEWQMLKRAFFEKEKNL